MYYMFEELNSHKYCRPFVGVYVCLDFFYTVAI
jgi:hypothetical protein